MKYKFSYKRSFFWKTYTIVGHNYDQGLDHMVLFFEDGGLLAIPKWKDCSVRLKQDWVLAQKKQMEREAGQSIPFNI